ncbi:Clp1/GlmU family protein [Allosphingosinicella deserti]|nr:polynucleotide 5'-hydroxyl-kinase [Sphingomonas deserti]
MIARGAAERIIVIGPTDVGKSSFIRALAARRDFALLDLDPGQKMVGPPGTVSRGRIEPVSGGTICNRFVFVGSTSGIVISRIALAAEQLAGAGPIVVNTSGFVSGPGARLQTASIAAVNPDLVIAIGIDAVPMPKAGRTNLLLLPRSPLARRKSPAERRRIRQEALDRHLGSARVALAREALRFNPAPPLPFTIADRPLCALADSEGEDMAIGVLHAAGPERIVVQCAAPPRPVVTVRLGSIWLSPSGGAWRLRDRLTPAAG